MILLVYFAAIASWAFDYRSESAGAGAAIQTVFFALFFGFSATFLLMVGRVCADLPQLKLIVGAITIFLLVGTFTGLFHGQSFYAIFVSSIPSLVYLTATYITVKACLYTGGSKRFLTGLIVLCGVYAITKAIIFAATYGINLSTVRYQILGSSTIACLGLMTMILYFKFTMKEFLIVFLNLLLILLSVTRTMLILPFVQSILYLLDINSTLRNRRVFTYTPVIITLVALVIGGDILLGTGLTDRWISRLGVAEQLGEDVTELTRVAEARYMREEWLASPSQVFFGNGMSSETRLAGPEGALAAMILGNNYDVHSLGFGHHQYWSLVYISGVFGMPLLLLYGFQAFQAALTLRRYGYVPPSHIHIAKLTCWGAMIMLGTFAYGFLAAFSGDRGLSLWLGVGTGLFIAGSKLLARYKVKRPGRRAVAAKRRYAASITGSMNRAGVINFQ